MTTPPYSYAPPEQRTNNLAIVSLVTSLVGLSIAGIITGHLSLNQIRVTGEQGRGLALAGLLLGYASIALIVVVVLLWILFLVFSVAYAGGAGNWSTNSVPS